MQNYSCIQESQAVINNTTLWYVIHTHPKQEDRAGENLRTMGALIFNPKIRERRYNQFSSSPTYVMKSLFPRYIFAQFDINELYHKVRYTRGVYGVVGFGDGPTPISDDIISLIQINAGDDGIVKIEEEIKSGERVMIQSGPLKNFVGIFERKMKDADRVRILLEAVSYQAHLELEKDMVKRVG